MVNVSFRPTLPHFIKQWTLDNGSKVKLLRTRQGFEILYTPCGESRSLLVKEKQGGWKMIRGIPSQLCASPTHVVRKWAEATYPKMTRCLDGSVIFSIFQRGLGGMFSGKEAPPPTLESLKDKLESIKKSPTLRQLLEFQDELSSSPIVIQNTPDFLELALQAEILVVALLSEQKCSVELGSPTLTFMHNGQNYRIQTTRGQGACAIHALLGKQINGVFRFEGDDKTSSARAKKHYTDLLESRFATKQIQETFYEMMVDYLNHPQGNLSGRMLFVESAEGRVLKERWDQLCEKRDRQLLDASLKEAEKWVSSFEQTSSVRVRILEVAQEKEHFKGKDPHTILTMMQENPRLLKHLVDEDPVIYLSLLEEKSKESIQELRADYQRLLEKVRDEKKGMIVEECLKYYVNTVQIPAFYLNTHEIKLAALLFNKNVLVFSGRPPQLGNEEKSNSADETVVIFHEGVHFSRCTVFNSPADDPHELASDSASEEDDDPLIDEDAIPSGTIVGPCFRIDSEEKRKLFMRFFQTAEDPEQHKEAMRQLLRLFPEEEQGFHYKVCKTFEHDPALLLNVLEQHPLPEAVKINFRLPALKKLLDSANQELEKIGKQYALSAGDAELASALEQLGARVAELRQQVTEAEKNSKTDRDKSNQLLKALWQQFGAFISQKETPQQGPDFATLFQELRTLNPWSIYPFFPILLGDCKDPELSKFMMQEASECDPYLTYVVSLFTVRAKMSFEVKSLSVTLENLSSLYPEDLIVSALIKNSSLADIPLDISRIRKPLSLALKQLASNQPKEAIRTLVKMKPQLVGFSFLYEYLALAWMLEGDAFKANQLIKRAANLMDPKANMSSNLLATIRQMFSWMDNSKPPRHEPDPPGLPSACIEFFQQKMCVATAMDFVGKCFATLKENGAQQLPWVYFGIKQLASQIALTSHDFDLYKPLWIEIGHLMSQCAFIHECSSDQGLDSFIAERFQRKNGAEEDTFSYIISFPSITSGLTQQEELPHFEFHGLELTEKSIHSISAILTKQLYSLSLGILAAHQFPKIVLDNRIQYFPDDPTLFSATLRLGLAPEMRNTPEFPRAKQLLEMYMGRDESKRPYQISLEVLEWAQLSANWGSHLQHAKQAVDRIAKRSPMPAEITLPDNNESLYKVFEVSQVLFGWRHDESFEKWGKRLERMTQNGPFAPPHNQTNHLTEHVSLPFPIVVPLRSDKAQLILREILCFWITFHQETKAKNDFIASGGDEDNSNRQLINFHEGLEPGLWAKIIRENEPQRHPSFNTRKDELSNIVDKKHKHAIKIAELKSAYEKRRKTHKKMPEEEFDIFTAAMILTNAEVGDRVASSPNIYVLDEKEARRIYRLLLEITIERVLSSEIFKDGPDSLPIKDVEASKTIIVRALSFCMNNFHGPETHPGGDAPYHWHYNAHVYTTSNTKANCHIFYGNE